MNHLNQGVNGTKRVLIQCPALHGNKHLSSSAEESTGFTSILPSASKSIRFVLAVAVVNGALSKVISLTTSVNFPAKR